MFGKFAIELYKISQAIIKLPTAIAKALIGDFKAINKVIKDYIIVPLNTFTQIISDTKNWVIDNFLTFWNLIKTPIASITIDLGLFNITLPNNKSYNELDINSIYKYFDPTTVIKFITATLSSGINLLISYVSDLIEPLTIIVSLDISKLLQALNDLKQYFIELSLPLIKIVNTFLSSIISIFNKTTSEINEIISKLYQLLLDAISGTVNYDIIPPELLIIFKFCYCFLKLIFDIIIALFTFQFI